MTSFWDIDKHFRLTKYYSNRKMKKLLFDKRYFSSGGYQNYLKNFKKIGRFYAKRLIEILNPKKSWKFLDVGCGMGGLVLSLREMGYKAFGIEISEFCLKNSPAKKWMIKANVLDLPFKENEFEVVTCIDVLEYLNKKENEIAISNLAKITKIFLFLEAITKFSPNASQKLNPNSKRKKNLLSAGEIIRIAEENKMIALGRILSLKERIDFNCLFLKNSSKNKKILIKLWKKSSII